MSATEPRAAAFFDFDRTVVDGDAGVLFGKELLRMRRRRLRERQPGTVGWAARNLVYEAGTLGLIAGAFALTAGHMAGVVKRSQLVRLAYGRLRGLDHDELRLLARDYFNEFLLERVYPQAVKEMRKHKAAGRRVVVVSTGMHIVIDPAQDHLPVDDVIAVHLVAPDGKLNGDVIGPLWGREKAVAVKEYAHARDLSLPRSYAYSDHYSDHEFLQLVGHPVAVNPDVRLRLTAARKRWKIETWRHKD